MRYNLLSAMIFIFLTSTVSSFAGGAPIRIRATAASSGTAALELHADELATMTTIPFRLFISDPGGRQVTGARVSCNMTMPSMTMPENRPRVIERDGAYAGELIFTCAMGAWQLDCLAEQPDGSRRTMRFDIDQVRMK